MILAALAAAAALTGAPPPATDSLDCYTAYHELNLYLQRAPIGTRTPPIVCQYGKVVPAPPGLAAALEARAPQAERTPNLYKVPEQCKDAPVKVQDRFGRPVAEKLADLPKGALIYAVDRKVDGCPVLVVVYGTPALDNPNPPARSGPEAATPVKHEDAPSNRR